MSVVIKIKRGTDAEVNAGTLQIGELAFATDTKHIYTYDGVAKVMAGKALINTMANRPAYGTPGRFFVDSATNTLYVDSGTEWLTVSSESSSAGIVVDGTAGEALAVYDVVYASSGEYLKGQSDNTEAEADVVGIVTEALGIANEASGEITLSGLVTNAGWSWTPGAQLFLSGTYGGITETEPTTEGHYVKPVGFAVTATQIFFNPQSGWVAGEAGEHASSHLTGENDEIDGDKLDIDWNPSNYTPTTVESYADSTDNLTAHLKGIDTAIGSSSGITTGKAIAMAMVFS